MQCGQDAQCGRRSRQAAGGDDQAGLRLFGEPSLISILLLVCVAEAESMATACPAAHNLCAAVIYTSSRSSPRTYERRTTTRRVDAGWRPRDWRPRMHGGPVLEVAPHGSLCLCVGSLSLSEPVRTAHTTECMNIKTPVRLASSGHRSGSGGTALLRLLVPSSILQKYPEPRPLFRKTVTTGSSRDFKVVFSGCRV